VLAAGARACGEIELVTCYARTPATRDAFAADHGCRASPSLDARLDDPCIDGVIVATTNTSHHDLIVRAAGSGKGIFVEKPLTDSADHSRAVVAAALRTGVVLQVGYQRRRIPAYRDIRARIEAGVLGDLMLLHANQSAPHGLSGGLGGWRQDPGENPLGSMSSLGVHCIDTLTYLAGPISRVSASSQRHDPTNGIDEAVALLLEFSSGAVGTVMSSLFTPRVSSVSVHGTAASAFVDGDGARLEVQLLGDPARTGVPVEPFDPIADEMREFGLALQGRATPETGVVEGLAIDLVMAAALESARTGRTVDVELC
jgi:predicted dehydrogenase